MVYLREKKSSSLSNESKDVHIGTYSLQVAFLAYQMHLKAVCMALLHSVALELLYYVLNRRRGICKEKKRDMRDHQQTTETGTVVYYILCTPIIHKKGRVLMCCGYSASWLPWKHLKRRRESTSTY